LTVRSTQGNKLSEMPNVFESDKNNMGQQKFSLQKYTMLETEKNVKINGALLSFYNDFSPNLIPLDHCHHLKLKSMFTTKTNSIGTNRIPKYTEY
jgi:hypothetical protein